jgi:hypothetical protein
VVLNYFITGTYTFYLKDKISFSVAAVKWNKRETAFVLWPQLGPLFDKLHMEHRCDDSNWWGKPNCFFHQFLQACIGLDTGVSVREPSCIQSEPWHSLKATPKLKNVAVCRSDDILFQKLIQSWINRGAFLLAGYQKKRAAETSSCDTQEGSSLPPQCSRTGNVCSLSRNFSTRVIDLILM